VGEPGGVQVGFGLGVAVGAGVRRGVCVGVGAGVGVGTGVGVGVGGGVGVAVGVDVDAEPIVSATEIVGNVPDPHEVDVAPPGLSAATAVQVSKPGEAAVPETRKTALSPMGRPTSGFLSGGFLNVTMVVPVALPVTTTHPWTVALVIPFTETIVAALTENAEGTETRTQVISSPPLLLPTFWTVRVTVAALPVGRIVGLADNVQARAASTAAGVARAVAPTRTARGNPHRPEGRWRVTLPSDRVSSCWPKARRPAGERPARFRGRG
jgi:hypothetical protein